MQQAAAGGDPGSEAGGAPFRRLGVETVVAACRRLLRWICEGE